LVPGEERAGPNCRLFFCRKFAEYRSHVAGDSKPLIPDGAGTDAERPCPVQRANPLVCKLLIYKSAVSLIAELPSICIQSAMDG
jgi:hypothetical protein